MQPAIDALVSLHGRLAAALTAKDVEEVQDLVRQRQDLLARLQTLWRDAAEPERRRHFAALQALHGEEPALLQRCESLRDEFARELASRVVHKTAPAVPDVPGLLDCQA